MRGKRWLFIMGGILLLEEITLLGLSGFQPNQLTDVNLAHAGGTAATSEPAYKKREQKEVYSIYTKNKNTLLLVNASNPLKPSYQPRLRTICNGRLSASKDLYDSLIKMLKAADKKGYQYWIASAYRSRDRQQMLVNEDVQKAMERGLSYKDALRETYQETMPAGHSEHETGLALSCATRRERKRSRASVMSPGTSAMSERKPLPI